jgi:hypothetical protein
MSSSISSSDDPAASRTPWRAWIRTFFSTAVTGIVALYAAVVLVDPYSTGRFAIFDGIDVAISNRVLGNVGRVRDSRFDAAIVGNSHAARFEPAVLDAASGRRFVQLSVPGIGPTEELVMARAFLAHHHGQGVALLLGIDHFWCRSESEDVLTDPGFPRWLYEPAPPLEYLRNIFSPIAVQATLQRLAIRLFDASPPARADGYFGREPTAPAGLMDRAVAEPRPVDAPPADTPFPELDRLAALVAAMDPQTSLVLFMPPYYVSHVPLEGSAAATRLDTCKARLAAIARRLPHGVLIDYMRVGDVNRTPDNFIDGTHPRDHVIRAIAADIGPVLRGEGQSAVGESGGN